MPAKEKLGFYCCQRDTCSTLQIVARLGLRHDSVGLPSGAAPKLAAAEMQEVSRVMGALVSILFRLNGSPGRVHKSRETEYDKCFHKSPLDTVHPNWQHWVLYGVAAGE